MKDKGLGFIVKPMNYMNVLEYKRLQVAISKLPNHLKKEKYTTIYKLEKEYLRLQKIEKNAKNYLNQIEKIIEEYPKFS